MMKKLLDTSFGARELGGHEDEVVHGNGSAVDGGSEEKGARGEMASARVVYGDEGNLIHTPGAL